MTANPTSPEVPIRVQQRLPLPIENTFVNWMDEVVAFWSKADYKTCRRCIYFEGRGYCAILHDRTVPDGDCLGVVETIGMKQP